MGSKTHDPVWFQEYWPPFRQHAHELLAWGYEDTKSRIMQDHEEEEITGFITEAIQNRLVASDCPRWCERYALKENNPVPGKGLTGKRRKVPDFIFELTVPPRPEYILEAKRLRTESNFREGYYFQKGLARFLREEYALRYLEAGMIGYMQCDTSDEWIERLKCYLHHDAEHDCKLNLKLSPHDVRVFPAILQEWVSEHTRPTGNDIAIYHILLNCQSN
ncbi:MAG TPA: hypothetical protein VGL94_08760 [Ktedonobacteraceae bacterium]|jgi:hypothetical protein